MTVLTFPSSPTSGQQYDAPNGIQYVFDGVKWVVETVTNTSEAISNSVQDRVAPMFVNGESNGITFEYDSVTNTFTSTITNATGYVLPTATGSVLGGVKVGSGLTITDGVLSANDKTSLVNGGATVQLSSNSDLTVPGIIKSTSGTSYVDPGDSHVVIQSSNNIHWTFDPNGTLNLPQPPNLSFNDPSIVFGGATSVATNNYGVGVPGPAAGVVYNATTINLASMKLLITIEGIEDGGDGLSHTQVCEMLVVRRTGLTVNTVDSVVYGVIHTSLAPLATLTAQLSVDGRVEILAQPTNSTPIYVKVYATEVVRGD